MKRTLIELFGLGVLSLILGFGVNAVRGKGRIKPDYDYSPRASAPRGHAGSSIAAPSKDVPRVVSPGVPSTPSHPVETAAAKVRHLEHDYQEIEFDGLVEVFKDPGTRQGLNVFVDARKEELFEEGRIPGAIHCDPYDAGDALDAVIARANGVERVIVYCSGGDCEDSILLCRQLVEAGVDQDGIYLYPGGWNEWVAKGQAVETGATER